MKKVALLIILIALAASFIYAQSAGTVDSSYGFNGMVITSFDQLTATANASAMQQDGKLLVVGTADDESVVVTRYNKNGSLDAGFGNGGKVFPPQVGAITVARDVAVQEDGKIVVAANGIDE